MKFDAYLNSLLPTFTKGRMLEDLGCIREELRENTLPPYKSTSETFGRLKFASEWNQKFNAQFTKEINFKYKDNFYTGIYTALQTAYERLDVIESLIQRYYEADDVVRDAMTATRVNLLQILEAISFVTRYARRVLIVSMAYEIDAKNADNAPTYSMSEGEVDWLQSKLRHFLTCLNVVSFAKTNEDFATTIDNLPKAVINGSSYDVLLQTQGVGKIDPMKMGLIPLVLNPIYHVRMAIADWQVSRYKTAQEEKKMLEFRLLKMKLQSQGKADAKLDASIQYTEGRLQELNYKLHKMENEYGAS